MVHTLAFRIVVLFAVIFFVAPTFALAAAGLPGQIVPERCNGVGGCQSVCDIATVAQNVLNTGIYIAVFLSAVLFAWAGWLYLTSVAGGEISRAKEIFVNVAIGLIIILAGWLVVDTLMRTLVGNGGSFGPWNKICELFVQQVSAFV
ncbi:MAG TPA: hypothetical protein VJK53_01550 [Candidatus Paceibacterota bacterium]